MPVGATGSTLGSGSLQVKAAHPVPSPAWREITTTLPKPVSTGDASALLASLRLPDTVQETGYEAKFQATDSSGHTTEIIRQLAPDAWNQLVLPTIEDGLKDVASVRVGVRSTSSGDTAGFSLDAVKLEYGHGGRNLAAAATHQPQPRLRPTAGVPETWWTPRRSAQPRIAGIEAQPSGSSGSNWISVIRGASAPCTFIP